MRFLFPILCTLALVGAEPNLAPPQIIPGFGGESSAPGAYGATGTSHAAAASPVAPPSMKTSGVAPRSWTVADLGAVVTPVGSSGWVRVLDLVVYDVWSEAYATQPFDGDFGKLTTPHGTFLVSRETALIRLDAITCLDTRTMASMAVPPGKSPTYLTASGATGFAPQSAGVGIVTGSTRLFAGMRTTGKISTPDALAIADAVGASTLQAQLQRSTDPLRTLVQPLP